MISYAQNHEDVLLSRLFPSDHRGFYIDIGANHPTHNSITRHFYDHGWTGINVEPGNVFGQLESARPRDINLNVAITDRAGQATLHEYPDRTSDSTLSPDIADDNLKFGAKCVRRTVPTMSLEQLCERYASHRTIDFMSIDVEGLENVIISGGDWQTYRPRVLVVEATRPHSRETADISWEQTLLENGYMFAIFDGLNRYYVRDEDREFLRRLDSPVCIHDDFDSYRTIVRVHKAVERANYPAYVIRRLVARVKDGCRKASVVLGRNRVSPTITKR
jgi:FkbM family methyltransferase